MEYVAAARSLTPMSRRTRHAHRLQLAADPPLQAPPPPPPLPPPVQLQPTTAGIGIGNGNGIQVQQQHSHRRMDLEQEVAELKQQLGNEQMVHHILERALHAPTNSSNSARSVLLNIPAFIPAKAKQLLAELVLVEEEITRLESQIHTMKGGLTLSQQQRASISMASNTYSYPASVQTNNNGNGNGNPPSIYTNESSGNGRVSNGGTAKTPGNTPTAHSAQASARHGSNNVNGGATIGNRTPTHTAPTLARQASNEVAPEIKSMFFISQAMNAEYLQRHLAATATDDKPAKSPRDQARGSSGAAAVSPKLNGNIFGLPPRNSLEKQSERAPEKPTRVSREPSPPAKRDEQSKTQLPNKLSERIVKCLAVIFIRLLRSSRVAEMEKSGNLARSGNLQGSFRIDTVLNVAAAKEKDQRGQQDHYGIFGLPDSVIRDIGPYKNLVRFTSSAFDLRGFSSSPLLTKLREMLEALQQVDLRFLTHQQKLAFWLNIYNTCIMHGILQHGLPSNSEKLLALKNKATINVSGQKFNALVIENFVLRQPSSVKEEFWKCNVDVEEQQVRGLYGLNSSEPNILFAMCCGTRSSPALRIYKADRVMMDLEKAKLDYLQASLVVTSTRRLMIPGLIHSNMHDFAKNMESLLRWICDQLPTSWSLRKSMVDCLRGHQGHLKVEDVVEVIPYDYEFQYLLPM
ncbi:hypothetical protein CFC21_081113 [Triticum aestivum]|uniref:DUF547 domain-containing protein n=2 Tax=Triticum aestivum TaxID=4565 RepID=A0A3B6N3B7_WHEAT|nr:uncharacterized protein LOC123123897 isoform X3 [Triticum aestivum]KAF7076471.1 hypothetical protein CFC21_081113 [Triticum aestivum]